MKNQTLIKLQHITKSYTEPSIKVGQYFKGIAATYIFL